MSVLKKTVLLCVLAAAVVVAQGQGAKVFPPTADQKAEIHKKLAELSARLAALGSKKTDPQLLADVQIYKKAAEYILRFPDEFFGANYAAETITALDTGIGRAIELENGTSSWTKKTGNVVRGFVSRIDGSVQPYGLTIPASYDGKRPMRLDVWLHGTQQQMNEVRFLQQQAGPHETSQILADDYIMVEPFARMNHSYKFYAETDVFEAIAAVQKALQHRRRAHRHPRPLDGRPSGLRASGASESRPSWRVRSERRILRNEGIRGQPPAEGRSDAVPGSGAALCRRRRLRAERVQRARRELRRREGRAVEGVDHGFVRRSSEKGSS